MENNEASTDVAAPHYTITSPSVAANANNNGVIASDATDVSAAFGQQEAAVEARCHPQDVRIVHTVGLDMESTSSTAVAVTPKNGTTSDLEATITTAVAVETMPTKEEGLLSNNVVANKSDKKTNRVNKYNNINNINNNNNNNNCSSNNRYNNNSDATVVGSDACDDDVAVVVEDENRMTSGLQRSTNPSSRPIFATSTSSITTEVSPSSSTGDAREDETSPRKTTRAANTSSLNLSLHSSSPSSPSAGPTEAPTTRSTPTRRTTPVPSLELQSEVTFRQMQQERQAGVSGTPNTTPTSAIMRTPPSPRAAHVILPLPRVTVTSPSDLSPPCNSSTTTLLMDEEDEEETVVTHSPPSPQSPTSPTIPLTPPPTPPPPRSLVIIPMSANPMLTTTANGVVGIGMIEPPLDMMNMIDMPPPPPYEGLVKADDSNRQSGGYGLSHMDTLPSYAVATDLPTYEEAERAKANEMRENPGHDFQNNRDQTTASHLSNSSQQSGGSRSGYPDDDRVPTYDPYHLTGVSIGTDWIFLCTFAISFLFNWLGFLISLCITNTVAGRCGALSGLGLSMVKWVVIMKHNTMAQGFLQGDSWVWWILMVCGFLLFLRGCIQYVNMKYEWKRIFSRLQQMYFS